MFKASVSGHLRGKILSSVSSILCTIVGVTTLLPSLSRADVRDEARAIVVLCQQREAAVLKGIQWKWRIDKGVCKSKDDAFKGVLDPERTETLNCCLLSNNGDYFSESIVQTRALIEAAPEIQKSKAGTKVAVSSASSEQFLVTKTSRLTFEPPRGGILENAAHGLSKGWGAGSIPAQSCVFGSERVAVLYDWIADPANQIELEDGTGLNGMKSKILTITSQVFGKMIYHFSQPECLILQWDHHLNGALCHRMVVSKVETLAQNDDQLMLPRSLVISYEKGREWHVFRMTSLEVDRQPAPLSDMIIKTEAKDVQIVLNPKGALMPLGAVNRISAENLDQIGDQLFSRLDAKIAYLTEMQRQRLLRIREEKLKADEAAK
jgi:hypothetical protein